MRQAETFVSLGQPGACFGCSRCYAHRSDIGMFNIARKIVWNTLHSVSAAVGFGVASYRQPVRIQTLRMVRKLESDRQMLLTPLEANQLFSLVRSTTKL